MKTKWAILILILAGFVAYGNTLRNGLFWDDDEFITKNVYIRSFRYLPQWFSQPLTAGAGVNSNYYRPLLQLSFAIDYKLWALWPAGYHLENLGWHTFAGILLYIFLNELLLKFSIRYSLPAATTPQALQAGVFSIASLIAFATSLFWLVHPVHVEAVAYANSRGDSMATVFILLSLILWMRKKYKWSSISFIAALLSKEFAIVTPWLIALISFVNLTNGKFTKLPTSRTRRNLFIMFIIASTYILLRLTVLNFQNTLNFYSVDMAKVDQDQPMVRYATSLPVRLMTFLKVLPIYGGILVWPSNLHMERTVDITTTLLDQTTLSSLIIVTIIVATSAFILYQGLAPPAGGARPLLIIPLAVGWFFISILPISGLIPISQILAEHFLYLPSIGFFLIVSWFIITIIFKIIKTEKWQRISLFFVFCSLLFPLMFKTIRQNRVWRDPITFYEYTLARAKPTARVYNNLAMAYADVKNNDKAIENYQKSIALGDVYPNPHYNLGNTFAELGKLNEAEKEYKRALEIDPNFHYAKLKLGQMYIDQGKIEEAKRLVCPVFPTQLLCL